MSVYFIYGDEDYLIDKRLHEIKQEALNGNVSPLNYKKINDVTYENIMDTLHLTGSMFGQVLSIIDITKLATKSSKEKIELNDKQFKSLEQAMCNVQNTNHIVFLLRMSGQKDKIDLRKKIIKILQKNTNCEHFEEFKHYEYYKAIPVVKKMVQERKIKITDKLIEKIVQTTGVSLLKLNNQLDKLELLSNGEMITDDMLNQTLEETPNIFNLRDYILKHDLNNFIKELQQVLLSTNILAVFALLELNFSTLFKTKLLCLKKMNSFEISKEMGLQSFVVNQNIKILEKIDIHQLIKIKQALLQVEYELKESAVKDEYTAITKLFSLI